MSIAANKVCGIRAAMVNDGFTARLVREHQHCNVICLGVDLAGDRHLPWAIEEFLAADFAKGRHARRVQKLALIEAQCRRRRQTECPRDSFVSVAI